MVVLFHAGVPLRGGFVGVDVFFVVSGFVISGLLLRELADTGRISLQRFYLRRARRLLPALTLVSVVTLAGAALFMSPLTGIQQASGAAAAAAGMFFANGYFYATTGGYFQQQAAQNPFLHTWSLSVEEQFYVGFPVLLLLGWYLHRRFSSRWLPGVVLLTLGVSLILGVCFTFDWIPSVPKLATLAAHPDLAMSFAFYSPITRAWEFLAGVAATLIGLRWSPPPNVARMFNWFGLTVLGVAALGLNAADHFPGVRAGLPVAAAVCLLLGGSCPTPTAVTQLLSTKPASALGDVSYSWYLWHWPTIVFATLWFPTVPAVGLVAAAGSLIPAIGSYRLVERPIHLGLRLPSRRAIAMVSLTCVLIPIAFGLALTAAAARSWWRPDIASINANIEPQHADIPTGCALAEPLGSPHRPPCTWAVPQGRGTILLIGDSNAGHLTEPMIGAAHALDMDLQVATMGGCPFLLRDRYFSDACRSFVEGSMTSIKARKPAYAAIVISNATVAYLNGPLIADLSLDGPAGTAATARQRAIAGWAADLGQTARQAGAQSPVVVIGAVPQFAGLPACLAPSILVGRRAGCGEVGAAETRRRRADIIAAERRAVATAARGYLDTGDRLCTVTGGCTAFVAGRLAYRDGAHLSVAGSLNFQPDLQATLGPLVANRPGQHP